MGNDAFNRHLTIIKGCRCGCCREVDDKRRGRRLARRRLKSNDRNDRNAQE